MAKKLKEKISAAISSFGDSMGDVNMSGLTSGISSAGASILGNAQVADSSNIDQSIALRSNFIPSANSNASLMSQWSNYRPMGNVSFTDVGGKTNGQIAGGSLSAALSGASAGTAIAPGIGTLVGAGVGLVGGLIGGLVGRNKANKKRDDLNKLINDVNLYTQDVFQTRASNLLSENHQAMMSNYFNLGGPLNTQGGEYGSDLTFINEGGTHQENPFGGVMVGVGMNGNPNLLEEGEVKFKDYVFSNSLNANKRSLSSFNLPETYKGRTFADISKSLNRESEERPNDPISKNGLEDSMVRLILAQEDYKMRKEKTNDKNYETLGGKQFALGGAINKPNVLLKGGPIDLIDIRSLKVGVPDPIAKGIAAIPKYSDINLDTYVPQDNPKSSIYSNQNNPGASFLRYAPVFGSAMSVLGDMTGATNRYDYSNVNQVQSLPAFFNPIGNRMTYNPLDRNYYANRLEGQSAGARRALIDASGGNRATASANILAADYNAQQVQGDLFRNAEEFNRAQRSEVFRTNRETDMFNTEGALRADQFNSEQALRAGMSRAQMMNMIDSQISQARSSNLSTLWDNIGEVGREAMLRNMINSNPGWLHSVSSIGNVAYKKPNKKKRGGKLTFTEL